MSPRGCLQKRLLFELADRIKKSAPPNADGHHPICLGPKENKKTEEGQVLSLHELGHPSSPALGHWLSCFLSLQTWTRTHTISPPGSQIFGLRQNYTTSFPGSSACRQQILGLSLHNHVNNFCNKSPHTYICIFICIYTYTYLSILLVLFLWRT